MDQGWVLTPWGVALCLLILWNDNFSGTECMIDLKSGQIGTVHQQPLILWNITHYMVIYNSLVDQFVVKYERTNLGQPNNLYQPNRNLESK